MISHNFRIINGDFLSSLQKHFPDSPYFKQQEHLFMLFIEEHSIFNSTHSLYSKNNEVKSYTRVFAYYNFKTHKQQYFYCTSSVINENENGFYLKEGTASDIMEVLNEERISQVLQTEILKQLHTFLTYQWTQQLEQDLNTDKSEKVFKKTKI